MSSPDRSWPFDLVDPADVLGPKDEADFMAQVIEEAELAGWLWHHETDSRKSNRGLPDLILVRPPRVIWAECKTDKAASKLTPEQRLWLDTLKACGQEVYVWRPSHRDRILEILR
tara:strand:+ start:830 stop:1174 length:345 start_codon:yes stop_codon:yes gene_type:complete